MGRGGRMILLREPDYSPKEAGTPRGRGLLFYFDIVGLDSSPCHDSKSSQVVMPYKNASWNSY